MPTMRWNRALHVLRAVCGLLQGTRCGPHREPARGPARRKTRIVLVNYWERWIGDWKRKTAHLSLEEKGAYGELLDHLYANETATLPMQAEAVYRIAGAQGISERRAIDSVLAQFFILDDAGHHNKRAMEEIEKRRAYIENQRLMGKRRWEKHPPEAHKGNGEDKGAPEPRGRALDVTELPQEWREFCEEERGDLDPERTFAMFCDYWQANKNQKSGKKSDWLAAWRYWVRNQNMPKGAQQKAPVNAKCAYCPQAATTVTNDIPHCARADHLDLAIARRR